MATTADHISSSTALLQTNYNINPYPTLPMYRIRLVPHLTTGSLFRFDALYRDLWEGALPLKIGRFAKGSEAVDKIYFLSQVVSRDHAEIWVEAGGNFYIRDIKSSSGTFLNHTRLSPPNIASKPFRIKDGDIIRLGMNYQGGEKKYHQSVGIRIEIKEPTSHPPANEEIFYLDLGQDGDFCLAAGENKENVDSVSLQDQSAGAWTPGNIFSTPDPNLINLPQNQEKKTELVVTRFTTPTYAAGLTSEESIVTRVDQADDNTGLLHAHPDPKLAFNIPIYRIRLVPHSDSHTDPSLYFNTLSRVIREGDPPLWIGRFIKSSLHSDKLAFRSKVVSKDHAEIWVEAGGNFYIKDTKSLSGTFLNYTRLSEPSVASRPFQINDGDILQLGNDYHGKREIHQRVGIRVEIEGPIFRQSGDGGQDGKPVLQYLATGVSDDSQQIAQLVTRWQDQSDHPDFEQSRAQTPNDPFMLEESIAQLLQARILSSKNSYKILLKAKGAEAQKIVNLLQNLLSSPYVVGEKVRGSILTALLRLSASSGLYPQQLRLHDIERESSPITAGKFGEIWRGRCRGLPVCLKIFKLYQKSEIDQLLKRCSREAIVWSQLKHPNLLPFYGIYHLDDDHGRVGLVSPWLQNGNLSEYLKAHPESRRLLFVHDILAGLQYLHHQQIVHGDLKGVNILVNADRSACLADFGLSSVINTEVLSWTSLATITQIGGTVRWMAPEIIEAAEGCLLRPTFESDIYSLASVIFEVFTGEIPYYELPRDLTVLSKMIQGIKPSRPTRAVAPELTDLIWEIMIDCWSRAPDDRPTIDQVISRFSTQKIHTLQAQPTRVELWGSHSPPGTVTNSDVSLLISLVWGCMRVQRGVRGQLSNLT